MISNNKKIYIIAEGGVNHNGKLSIAKKLVKAAKFAGASAIKFQSFKAENLATKKSKKAPYQIKNTKNKENQFSMLKKLELKPKDYFEAAIKEELDFLNKFFDEIFEHKQFSTKTLQESFSSYYLLINANFWKVVLRAINSS